MKPCSRTSRGFTLVELMVTTVMIGILGLIIFSLLNVGTVLGAKNSAINVAHQQARTAMLQLTQDLRASISPLTLFDFFDLNGNPIPLTNPDGTPNNGPAGGIAFQLWSGGPYRIVNDAAVGDTVVRIQAAPGSSKPNLTANVKRLIVPTHEIEENITAVNGTDPIWDLTLGNPLTVAIKTTDAGGNPVHVVSFITDRCSYLVSNGSLQWRGPTTKKAFAVLGNDITNPKPFTTPVTPAGAPNIRLVAAINLSTADPNYSNRNFKSANILLNGQVPMKAKLTNKL